MKAEEYSTREVDLAGWKARITSYKSGDTYHCSVDNVSPGAVVARAEGKTRQEAEQAAVEKATKYFSQTRRFDV